eukprot:6015908-Pleurochrysis_carterae.AAC.1
MGKEQGGTTGGQEGTQDKVQTNEVVGVIEKRRTAECWGGEEYLTKWDNGEQRWISKLEVQTMKGTDADKIYKEREFVRESRTTFAEHMRDDGIEAAQTTWDYTWREFLLYAQRGDGGKIAKENVIIDGGGELKKDREPHPTLYPGEVVGNSEVGEETRMRGRNMARLTERARDNKRKQDRKGETYGEKRARLARGGEGSRLIPAGREDTVARKLLGGHDGRGRYTVFKDDTLDLAHEAEYAGHPILRLFTRPEEIEQGTHKFMTSEDIQQMNGVGGKKLTYETLSTALTLHEKHDFHVAAATDGAKKGGTKDRTESQRISETTYGVWQGPESTKILREERREATTLQERLGVQLNQTDKVQAIEQGTLSGRLGDSATSVEAELFAIFAILRKV